MQISISPNQTTSPSNSFLLQTTGFVQGSYYDDPSSKNWLAAGFIASSVTQAVWGGMAITENIPGISANQTGENLVLASAPANITGFTVFNQASNGLITPGNTVPQYGSGMSISYFRLTSNARIAVQCSNALANALTGGATNQQVSWDFTDQILVPYTAGYSGSISGAVWASTNGGQTTFTVGTNPTTNVPVGEYVQISGVVNTGGSSTGAFNGSFLVVSTSSTTIVVAQPASGSPGTYASGGTAAVVGGALPVKVLGFDTNSKIVSYNSITGALSWTTGPAAIIQI